MTAPIEACASNVPKATLIAAVVAVLLLAPADAADEPELGVPILTLQNLRVVVHGTWGDGPGEFGRIAEENVFGPELYTIDTAGNLVILDSLNDRLQVFDRQGRFVRSVPVGRTPEVIALAAGPDGHVYMTTGSEVRQVALDTGQILTMGSPPELFGPIRDLAVGSIPSTQPQQPPHVALFLAQAFPTFDGMEMWVHGYMHRPEGLVRFGGMTGHSPFRHVEYTLYTIGSVAVAPEGTDITIRRWNYQEQGITEVVASVPVRITQPTDCILLGVSTFPPSLHLLTLTPGGGPGGIWKLDRSGKLMGAIVLGDHLPPPPMAWMNHAARFAVDGAGDLHVSWADPGKGYYISRLRAALLGR